MPALTPSQDWYRNTYLLSPHWRAVRARILHRADEHCERCGRFCGSDPHEGGYCGTCEWCWTYFDADGLGNDLERQGLEVHHKTYERVGGESDRDLIALCWTCHESETDWDRLGVWP